MEIKAIQGREKRWTRRGRLLSLFGCLPLRTCMSRLRCPEKRRRGTEVGEGPRKWIENRWARRGRQVQFLTVSHWSPVPSSMPGIIIMTRERQRRVNSRENEKLTWRKTSFGEEGCRKIKIRETKNREKMGKARTSAKPFRLSATSNLHVPSSMPGKEKEWDRAQTTTNNENRYDYAGHLARSPPPHSSR